MRVGICPTRLVTFSQDYAKVIKCGLIKGGNHSEVIPSVKITGTVINGKGVICKIDGTLAIKAIIIPNGLAGFLGGVSITTLVQPSLTLPPLPGHVCGGGGYVEAADAKLLWPLIY